MHQSSSDDPIPASGEAGTMDVDDLAGATDDERATEELGRPATEAGGGLVPDGSEAGL